MNETLRRRRGHAFLPPKAVMSKIPAIYGTEDTQPADKVIWAHYFAGGLDWWIAELDPETFEAFGYTRNARYPEGAEWGYIDLAELEQVQAGGMIGSVRIPDLVVVERDMHWTPCPFSEVGT